MSSNQRRRGQHSREAGASAIEFALALPLLLTVAFGLCMFGLAIFDWTIVSQAAREGARWASVRGTGSTTVATTSSVQTYVEGRTVGLTPITVTTTWTPASKAPGSIVRVDVSYNFSWTLPFVGAKSFALSTSADSVVAR
jgi:Flp pilus assembly protein TadG